MFKKRTTSGAIFYFKSEGKDASLFYVNNGNNPKKLITILAEGGDPGEYKAPKHIYVSHNGNSLIYFEKTGLVPIQAIPGKEDFTMYRIIYKPKFVDLGKNSIKDINQDIDTSNLLFSPDDKKIAWVLSAKESTLDELEKAGRKREVFISDVDGTNAKSLTVLDDNVVLLERWQGDYIYFRGIKGVGYYSLGRTDIKTGKTEYIKPKYCSDNLANCQNFNFSSSGEFFIYEASSTRDNKNIIELFAEDFNNKRSWQILCKNYISDRLWMPDEKNIIYTEQENVKEVGIREKIHLVDLKTNKDQELYTGSYVSQIFPGRSGDYLYFLEKETDTKFNLVRLNIKTKKSEILDFGDYSQFQIFSAN